jgi:WhiB family redox-sensing transcriptional regulator
MFAYHWADDNRFFEEDIDWQDAACSSAAGSLTRLFFSDEAADIELAKSICSTCSLVSACLEGALARREPAGVWGGQLFVEGQVVAFKRKRGRPPKSAPATTAACEARCGTRSVVRASAAHPESRACLAKLPAGQSPSAGGESHPFGGAQGRPVEREERKSA